MDANSILPRFHPNNDYREFRGNEVGIEQLALLRFLICVIWDDIRLREAVLLGIPNSIVSEKANLQGTLMHNGLGSN
jgi:hypothetical protein